MSKTWKEHLLAFWKGWGISILVAVIIATSFRSAIADWNDVPTGSMIPTIWEGDRIFVNKLAYDFKVPYTTWHLAEWGDPQRGEIVVFFSPADGKRLVKRIVGLPGDEIALRKNQLIINGTELTYEAIPKEVIAELSPEEYKSLLFFEEDLAEVTHPVMITPNRPSAHTFAPITVPDGQYFMMGDNRDNSADSRFFGFVERQRIVGRATRVVLSLEYRRYFNFLPGVRWDRSFQPLL